LRELGWVRGKNLLVEERWANGHADRMPALAADVVAHKVDVIVTGTEAGALATKKATQTIPIVAVALGDPVAAGVAASIARPGGNVTGLSVTWEQGISGKCIELLREVVPRVSSIAVFWNPDMPLNQVQLRELEATARMQGIQLRLVDVRSQTLRSAFEHVQAQTQAAIVLPDPITYSNRREVASLAAHYRLPAIYLMLDYVTDGGLMAYGADLRLMYRRAAEYVDKILRGANPGDLPIEQSTQMRLAVSLKTARALGINVPDTVVLRADDVLR
jgi:putative ABC transport system substrate-binding protein